MQIAVSRVPEAHNPYFVPAFKRVREGDQLGYPVSWHNDVAFVHLACRRLDGLQKRAARLPDYLLPLLCGRYEDVGSTLRKAELGNGLIGVLDFLLAGPVEGDQKITWR